jgi:D-aspartate ligase
MPSNYHDSIGVIVTTGISANSLGVIRGFGRRGIPVVYLDSEPLSMGRYSRYVSQRLKCRSPRESEIEFINVLLDFGKQVDNKMVIIPTGDMETLALSKYKKELEQFYHLPVPAHEIVQKLVNKKIFYKLLAEMQVPHPRTYFPENTIELALMGKEIDYPYIIKPAYSPPFQEEFYKKCFVINSPQELDWAVERLRGKNLEFIIQEIIPGKEIYEFYTYFNKESEPLAACGWDKIRHYPPDFGSGSFCRSSWCPSIVEQSSRLLKAIGYYGLAAPELKKDSRDGKYKLVEINARTILQNRLTAACGIDITYIAYLDAIGQAVSALPPQRNGVVWVDDFVDLLSCWIHLRRKEIGIGEIIKSLRARKVHSVAAWDDPIPLIVNVYRLCSGALRRLLRNSSRVPRKSERKT